MKLKRPLKSGFSRFLKTSTPLALALALNSAVAPLALAQEAAGQAPVEVGSQSQLEKSISGVVQYTKAAGSGSAIVLAENARGEQILLTNSQNMGQFFKSTFGEFVELTDWTLDNSLVHVGSGHLARIPKVINGVLNYTQSVAFYRPRPRFQGQTENPKRILPGSDFGLALNTNRTDVNFEQFDRTYHDEFEKKIEFSDVVAGDSVFVAGVSAMSYPSPKSTARAGIVATSDEAETLLTEAIYDEAGRVEAAIAFDAAKEILVLSTEQVKGFLGGALLDEGGRLAGVIIRSGTTQSGVHFYRVLKSSFIEARLTNVQFPYKIRSIVKTLLEVSSVPQECLVLVPSVVSEAAIQELAAQQAETEAAPVEAVIADTTLVEVEAPRMAALTSNSSSVWSRLTAKLRQAFGRTLQGPDAK